MADIVIAGAKKCNISIKKDSIINPRTEMQEHYYNPKNDNLINLGLKPTFFDEDLAAKMIKKVEKYSDEIDDKFFDPKIKWVK